MNLSCAAICFNEEHNIIDFLSNLKSHNIKNLYITDTGSTDRTIEIIRDSWPDESLFLTEIQLMPFDFSCARNTNIKKIQIDEKYIIHLDIDERIVSLPKYYQYPERSFSCQRIEKIWGTNSYNMLRITPAQGWFWENPIHESIRYTGPHATEQESANFIIEHLQKIDKNFYSDLTEYYFLQPEHTKRLFFHRMCDLMREEKYVDLIKLFEDYYENTAEVLSNQQKWQSIRNYQLARIKTNQKPNESYMYIFHDFPSQSSYYYLSFLFLYLGDEFQCKKYFELAETVNFDSMMNSVFYNKNIKNYLYRALSRLK